MIRVNLLGQTRPKGGQAERSRQILILAGALAAGLLVAGTYLWMVYAKSQQELVRMEAKIVAQKQERTRLQQVAAQVRLLQGQESELEHHLEVVRQLANSRRGGEEMLAAVENSVARTDELWLTSLKRKGDGVDLEGEAGSINAVANLIAALQRSGYFTKVDITEAKEDDNNPEAVTYTFGMTAQASGAGNAAAAAGKS